MADCGEQVMTSVNEYDHREPQWLALQENLEIKDRVRSNSLAWCSYRDGKIGRLCVMDKWLDSDIISALLGHNMVKVIDEPLFTKQSTWDQFLDLDELESYAKGKSRDFSERLRLPRCLIDWAVVGDFFQWQMISLVYP